MKMEINYSMFAVGKRPFCVWEFEMQRRNVEFLEQLDPRYFDYVARTNGPLLGGPDRHRAAVAIRIAYYHALETFFSLLCAGVQAPECLVGWLLKYEVQEVRRLVTRISQGQPILTKFPIEKVAWPSLSEMVNRITTDSPERADRVRKGFASVWARFAHDFTDSLSTAEYNTLKHGFRTSHGGFRMAMGIQPGPGIPAAPEAMRDMGGSDFGTSFFKVEDLGPRRGSHFRCRRQMINWNPVGNAHALQLLAVCLSNLISFLRSVNGVTGNLPFGLPKEDSGFDAPWADSPAVKASSFDQNIPVEGIKRFTDAEILATYDEKHDEASDGAEG